MFFVGWVKERQRHGPTMGVNSKKQITNDKQITNPNIQTRLFGIFFEFWILFVICYLSIEIYFCGGSVSLSLLDPPYERPHFL